MSDDLVERLREIYAIADEFDAVMTCPEAANRIEELEAKLSKSEALLAKAWESLTVIDALDPEGMVNGCSQSALIGLVSRMGAIARTTLAELSSVSCANLKGQKNE